MKILRIAFNIPPHIGGMEKHIFFLTQKQKESGHEVDVIYSIGDKISQSDKKLLVKILKPNSLRDFVFCCKIVRYLRQKKTKYDVVHIHGDWSLFIWGKLFKLITGAKRLVGTNHATVYPGVRKKLLAYSIRKFDTMFYTGYEAYSAMSSITESVFQPSGINPLFLNQGDGLNEKKYDVITTAYRRPEKNLKTVVEIARQMSKYSFVLIGSGPESEMLVNLISSYHLNNITLMESMPVDRVLEYLKSSRVFLLTSIQEGTPTSIMEAMAIGLPIVSSDVCGISKTVKPGVNGYMVSDPYDVNKYREALETILENESIYKKMSDENRKESSHFDWNDIERRITSFYSN